jgi:hypothetical protein
MSADPSLRALTDIIHVISNLYISALGPACDVYEHRETLHKGKVLQKQIAYVLYLNDTDKPAEVLKKYDEHQIRHLCIGIEDRPFDEIYRDCSGLLAEALKRDENILVHCNTGQYAPCVLIAFLLVQNDSWKLASELRELIETKWPAVSIDHSLWEEMLNYCENNICRKHKI